MQKMCDSKSDECLVLSDKEVLSKRELFFALLALHARLQTITLWSI